MFWIASVFQKNWKFLDETDSGAVLFGLWRTVPKPLLFEPKALPFGWALADEIMAQKEKLANLCLQKQMKEEGGTKMP